MNSPPRRIGAIGMMLAALAPMMMIPSRRELAPEIIPPETREPPPRDRAPIIVADVSAAARAIHDVGVRAQARRLSEERTRAVLAAPFLPARTAKPCFRCERSQFGKCRAHRDAARTAAA